MLPGCRLTRCAEHIFIICYTDTHTDSPLTAAELHMHAYSQTVSGNSSQMHARKVGCALYVAHGRRGIVTWHSNPMIHWPILCSSSYLWCCLKSFQATLSPAVMWQPGPGEKDVLAAVQTHKSLKQLLIVFGTLTQRFYASLSVVIAIARV